MAHLVRQYGRIEPVQRTPRIFSFVNKILNQSRFFAGLVSKEVVMPFLNQRKLPSVVCHEVLSLDTSIG